MKINLLSILLILLSLTSFSQENLSEQTKSFFLENDYITSVDKEKFYLQTNKTTYYAGEKIWFKAYIVEDSSNKPHLNTTNVFVNFYSPEKKLISSQLFYAEAGSTYGEIELHPELIFGTYYIDINTQRNKNFNSCSVIPIQILNTTNQIEAENRVLDSIKNSATSFKNKDNYIVDFYPESQILLKDEVNNIAFTIRNNNNPVKASGKIIDTKTGKTVSNFMSDTNGMGKFNLLYDNSFSAVLKVNGIEKSFALPPANSLGFIIQKNPNSSSDSTTSFLLKTNAATCSNYQTETLILALNRNGIVKSIVPIEINSETAIYQINLSNESLFSGINTLTLFDKSNKPISEYSFWNEPTTIDLDVTQFETKTDSITLNFRMGNKLADANLSVSVMPAATVSYNNQQNIITEFQLAPYLNEPDFSLAKFYNDTNGDKHSMDLLIQTTIRGTKIQTNYKSESDLPIQSEHGVKIRGTVNFNGKDLSKHKVLLTSTENNIMLLKPLKGEKQFEFDSLMLRHPSKYSLALLNNKGEIEKAQFYIYNNFNKYRPDSLLSKPTQDYSKTTYETVYNIDDEYVPLLMDEVVLNEVMLKAEVKSDKELLAEKIDKKVIAKGFTQVYIPDEKTFAGADLVFYIRSLPGTIVSQEAHKIVIFSSRGAGAGSLTAGGEQVPYQIFLDDIPVYDHSDLLNIKMFDISSVTINTSGAGYGLRGGGGVINIYSKIYDLSIEYQGSTTPDPLALESETEFGFSTPTETFINSEVYYPNQSSEELYSTIDWIPNFYLNSKTPNYLTVSTKKHQNLKLFINGMNANGQLVYKVVTIKRESN
jgi:hypothetical protein